MRRIVLVALALSAGACRAKDLTAGERGTGGTGGTGGTISHVVCPAGAPSLQLLAGAIGALGTIDGVGSEARFFAPSHPTLDGEGNLYVVESTRVRKVSLATGAVVSLAGAVDMPGHVDGPGPQARFDWVGSGGFTSDQGGKLYLWDIDSMREIVTATGAVTTLPASFSQGKFVTSMAHGGDSVYLMDCGWIGGVRLATGETRVITTDAAGDCGPPPQARWVAITADSAPEALYLTDGRTIRQVSIETGEVTFLAGSTQSGGSDVDGVGAAALLSADSLSSDGAGHLYFNGSLGGGRNTVRRLDVATRRVTTVATLPETELFGVELVTDRAGSVYLVSDSTVHKLVLETGVVTRVAGASPQRGETDGRGAAARFYEPGGIAADAAGDLFVVDGYSYAVRRIAVATGEVTTLMDPSNDAALSLPRVIVNDGVGQLLAVNSGDANSTNLSLLKVTGSSVDVTTLTRWEGDHARVWAIAADGHGHIFATHNDRTISVTDRATGASRVLAGRTDNDPNLTGLGTQVDGPGPSAGFAFPYGLVSDGANVLFVADGRLIRRIDATTGEVTTVANFGPSGATFPRAEYLTALTRDGAGNLYVVDDSIIRKLDLSTGEITTVAGAPGQAGVVLGCPPHVNRPEGLAALPDGRIAITDENSVLLLSP